MLAKVMERLAPRFLWRHRATSWGFANDDPEFSILPQLVDRQKLSVDVGGAGGVYAAMLVPLSQRVMVFEPVPRIVDELKKKFAGTALVRVEAIALSDASGVATMRVPVGRFWRSTIEQSNALRHSGSVEEISVRKKTLDEYALRGVGFVKIDVEGHELAVLHGAVETLQRERPTFLVEVEEQHRAGALREVFEFFERAGYRGLFLLNYKPQPLSAFDSAVHQNLKNLDDQGGKVGLYINNFAFVPSERKYPGL